MITDVTKAIITNDLLATTLTVDTNPEVFSPGFGIYIVYGSFDVHFSNDGESYFYLFFVLNNSKLTVHIDDHLSTYNTTKTNKEYWVAVCTANLLGTNVLQSMSTCSN